MAILHNLLVGASAALLDVFAGAPIAPVTITVLPADPVAGDFERVAADLAKAMRKIEGAHQLELDLFAPTKPSEGPA